MSWLEGFLRGAVSIFLAAIPTLARIENAEAYFNVAFIIVLLSLIVQGTTLQLALELIGFYVVEGSPILAGTRLPAWARLVLVVRDGQVLESDEVGALRAADFCYFLAPPRRAHDLDALFVAREPAP